MDEPTFARTRRDREFNGDISYVGISCTHTHTYRRVRQIRGRNGAVPSALLPPTTLRRGERERVNGLAPSTSRFFPDDIPRAVDTLDRRIYTSIRNIRVLVRA